MPGSSLWLLPPSDHPLTDIITTVIKKTAAQFNSPHLFIPHITLTSEISPSAYGSDAQSWLNALPFLSAKYVRVRLGKLESQEAFFKKLYSRVEKNEGVKGLGKVARMAVEGFEGEDVAEMWVQEKFMPHLSLLYWDGTVTSEQLAEIERFTKEAGINLNGEGELAEWEGGRVVLVPTDKAIKEWAPIAERGL
ncbi:2',3'-cyclic-nucleotide 3'-phosphodiesteras-like protein [Delitschia confertaspora ATCC 74209]|uniref:2',3'-cyclic-nucleotide 3'-phosphodiesteras-like protein n=1 Tax=Delitschia confertaspora ATCC 74209 TaxID=1513339 RepID=A0A9P4MSB2_9PLEO|nr:2',3'-cyclic-nucleotide 3'-phosphodiesteras-like protein [Delitschia confertaspora ATCC 74209]